MGMRQPQHPRALIVLRAIAGERRCEVGKFTQHATAACPALDDFHLAAAHQRDAMIFLVRGRRRGHIGLVAFRIAHIDLQNPIACAMGLPLNLADQQRRFQPRSPRPRLSDRLPQGSDGRPRDNRPRRRPRRAAWQSASDRRRRRQPGEYRA